MARRLLDAKLDAGHSRAEIKFIWLLAVPDGVNETE
jgi:hypothetical protein